MVEAVQRTREACLVRTRVTDRPAADALAAGQTTCEVYSHYTRRSQPDYNTICHFLEYNIRM